MKIEKNQIAEVIRKEYLAPHIDINWVEMEQGIAAGSATVSPAVTAGNTDNVSTDWNTGTDTGSDLPSPF